MAKRYLVEVEGNEYYVCTTCKDSIKKQAKEGIVGQFRVIVAKNCSKEQCYSCRS